MTKRTTELERAQDVDYLRRIRQKDVTDHGRGEQMFAVKVPSAYFAFLWYGGEAFQHRACDRETFLNTSSPVCCDREEEIAILGCHEARKEGEL